VTFLVAVTYRPEEADKRVLESELKGVARIGYLPDLNPVDRSLALERADVVFSRSCARAEIEPQETAGLKKAGLIQLVFAGANNVPFETVPTGVAVASNAGAFAAPLAEHVLAMALCLAKAILPGHLGLAEGRFDSAAYGKELKGGVCGIIGMGGNGAAIARLMRGIGMAVHGINRSGASAEDLDFVGTPADMDSVLSRSDVLVLTTPLNRQTRNLIGRRELGLMKQDAILINVGRGGIVQQRALFEHLKATPSFSAGIDTWWSEPGDPQGFKLDFPFFDLPNLIGSPHKADHVPGILTAATRMAAQNVRRFLEKRPIRSEVRRGDYTV